MESKLASKLCSVSLVFPYDDNAALLSYKTEIDKVVAALPQCKLEYRFVEVKSDGGPNGQGHTLSENST